MAAGQTYTPINTITITGSSTNQVDFTSIPQTYTDIVIVAYVRSLAAASSDIMNFWLNNDNTSLYGMSSITGDGSAAAASRETGIPFWRQGYGVVGNTATANYFGYSTIHLNNYTNTNGYRTALWRSGSDRGGTGYVMLSTHVYKSQTAMSRATFSCNGGNFAAGTVFSLYGITAA